MSEGVKVNSKKPEEKRENRVSQTRKPEKPQSTNTPVEEILHLQRTVGNQAVQKLIKSDTLQAKLKISQPDDIYEQEADRVAEQVMSMPEPRRQRQPEEEEEELVRTKLIAEQITPVIQRQDEEEKESEEEKLQTKKVFGQAPEVILNLESSIKSIQDGGQPLPKSARAFFEPRFRYDFSKVRVYHDVQAAESARAVNAQAFTLGKDIVFGRGKYAPEKASGRRLLAHELTHVVQQGGSSFQTFQRRVNPEDVVSEMVGQMFEVAGPFTSGEIQLSGGETVYVVSWSNTSDTAQVQLPSPFIHALIPFNIRKTLLRPPSYIVSGIAPYSAKISQQVRSIERGEQRITTERLRSGGPRPGEIPRLEALQQKRQRLLNRRLIQETMFNRFDPIIQQWTDYYNRKFGYTGPSVLDSNLVKAMLFQESQMGTAGQHLEISPTWEVRSRFNIGQVIDSAASALLIMMNEMQPSLITSYRLHNIKHDRVQAQEDLRRLTNARTRTSAEQIRLTELQAIQAQSRNWGLSFAETFMWLYRAPGQAHGFNEAVEEFFSSVAVDQPRRSIDYDFWIRTSIRWLFEKRLSVSSWQEAIRAYNGSGVRARHYREAVQKRANEAISARGLGRVFIPSGI